MTTKTISEVREITLSAISFSSPIIAISLCLLSVEAYSSLHTPSVGSVLLQPIKSEGNLRIVRDDRYNARTTFVVIIGDEHLGSRLALPMIITLVPHE